MIVKIIAIITIVKILVFTIVNTITIVGDHDQFFNIYNTII